MRTFFEPPVFSGFRSDGTYLGDVRFPLQANVLAFAGGTAWGVMLGKDDQQQLVRWIIH
jgi:hypothetical protein